MNQEIHINYYRQGVRLIVDATCNGHKVSASISPPSKPVGDASITTAIMKVLRKITNNLFQSFTSLERMSVYDAVSKNERITINTSIDVYPTVIHIKGNKTVSKKVNETWSGLHG